MSQVNRRVLLVSRPEREARVENFELVETPLAPLAVGEVRVRNHFLSIDPYMRGRMNAGRSYAEPQPLGEVMGGGTAGEVVESRNPAFAPGDRVIGAYGWQEYGTSTGKELRKVDTTRVPLSAYLGAAGMPGVTAWYGLNRIIRPRAGETLVVSAGGADKCRYVVDTLGFDACVDYKAGRLADDLAAAAPDGVDGCFENVGGAVLDATLARMNPFGRIAMCGMIAAYDGAPAPLANPALILRERLLVQGFIVSEHFDVWPEALAQLASLVANRQLHYRETIAQGLERAPDALLGLLKGRNFGKQLVALV
ncbi:zinc-binding oxidoreductase family protein [Burkholderia pseudomallei]|nr:zinc-binding oxidoreductase family protein [Burkholderia pseudomallei]CAJ3744901.1 zinc-binding oxidoreductase family protein [Burkholderia pseudomallei]